ncbi:hypothetical protein [Pirellulimonas nuda]|uniref:hypothetical protein n=1 Tax=Pirellulimonas nuda TaxID=2528009 RepID=UPI00119E6B52|nr:hypothetical protein [Pirellulimonas nuda]
MASSLPCHASITIDFDLNDGQFVTLPATGSQATDYLGVYQSPTFVLNKSILPGESLKIWLNFQDGGNAQRLHLDEGGASTLPNEGILLELAGIGQSQINFDVQIGGATGSYRTNISDNEQVVNAQRLAALGGPEPFDDGARLGEFSADYPNDPARFSGIALDLTQEAISFTSLHIDLFNAGTEEITLSELVFLGVANEVSISTAHAIPEPYSVLTWLGLAATGALVRGRRGRARVDQER